MEHRRLTVLIFVEVKLRTSAVFGGPALAISPRQQQRIRRSAGYFLKQHPHFRNHSPRFDAVLFVSLWRYPDWRRGIDF